MGSRSDGVSLENPSASRAGSRRDPERVRLVGVATSRRVGSDSFMSASPRKLNDALGARTVPSELPLGQLLGEIRKESPEICHLQLEYHSFGGHTLSGRLRTFYVLPRFARLVARDSRLVVTVHGVLARDSLPGLSGRLSRAVHRYLVRRAARYASAMVVLSETMRNELVKGYGVPEPIVIPHGCDDFPTSSSPGYPPYMLFRGFLRPSKGLFELVDAFGLLGGEFPELELVIAGTSVYDDEQSFVRELEAKIASNPFRERIRLLNRFVEGAEMGELVRSARLMVLPYKDRFIEVSGVVHDVAGAGLPLVCSDAPRFDELVEGVEALHAPACARSIADAVQRILREPSLSKCLSEGIRELARRESWGEIARQHLDLYARVGSPRRAAIR
jgi:glycosyltransferase involved in cell wall biosynthesis